MDACDEFLRCWYVPVHVLMIDERSYTNMYMLITTTICLSIEIQMNLDKGNKRDHSVYGTFRFVFLADQSERGWESKVSRVVFVRNVLPVVRKNVKSMNYM